jgi:hypothetical protein
MPLSQVTGKKAIGVPVYKGGYRLLVTSYRPVSLTSVVCKQMEHVTASYLRKVWEKRTGYSRVNMRSGRDIHVKVKQSRFARTLQTHWVTEAG